MRTATIEARVTRSVIVCDRCKVPRSQDAKPLAITYDGSTQTASDFCVCKQCAKVILNGLVKTPRKSRAEAGR